ncbi:MAG TPA: PKD domain-containing protein [Acidobacteriota bacterium]|nr:PKD domain-containing protein [Acidobacteriota bacterium]
MMKCLKILGILCVLSVLISCQDSGTNAPPPQPQQPLSLQSVSPNTVNRGAVNAVIELTGGGFRSDFNVDFGGGFTVVSKEFIDASHVKATVNVARSAATGPRVITATVGSQSARLEGKFSIGDNVPPTGRFTITPAEGTINTTFTFDASTSSDPDGRIATFQWTFNDGPPERGKIIEKRFPDIGEVSVKLTVTDDKNSAHIVEKKIDVADNSKPLPAFTVSPPGGYTSTVFTFDASASIDPDGGIRTFEWSFGDGKKSTGRVTTHRFAEAGEFSVELKVKDSSGAEETATKKVQVFFFDVDKAKAEINDVCTNFLRLFEDLEFLSADEIVVGFSRNCAGRAREIAIIEGQQPIVDRSSVDILGPTEITSVNPHTAKASLTARFFGVLNDGSEFDGVATHNFTMINEDGEWKICNFNVVRHQGSGSLRMFESVEH